MLNITHCMRCGRTEQIEEHHILERCHSGGDEPENKEYLCRPCHKYEHTRRALVASIEYEKRRGQRNRIKCYVHRLEILEKFNNIQIIRERGTYLSYWNDRTTRYLPRRIPTKEEERIEEQFNLLLTDAQMAMVL